MIVNSIFTISILININIIVTQYTHGKEDRRVISPRICIHDMCLCK